MTDKENTTDSEKNNESKDTKSGANAAAPASTAPISKNNGEIEEGEEEEELTLVDGFEQLYRLAEDATNHVKGDKFFNKLQSRTAVAVRDELRDNIYEMIKKLIFWCGRHAVDFEDIEEKVFEMAEEVDKQGRLLRDMATGSVLTLAAGLANAVLQKSQDQELRGIAQSVLASLGPIGAQVAQAAEAAQAQVAASNVENPGEGAAK